MMSRLGSPKGLFAFFEEDLEEADCALFGRESYPDRRGFDQCTMAEREGFEPSERLRAQRFSSSKALVPTCTGQ